MTAQPAAIDVLSAAVVHEVKNQLAELQWRLAKHVDLAHEQSVLLRCGQQLSNLLLLQREQAGALQASVDAFCPGDILVDLAAEYAAVFPAVRVGIEADAAPEHAFADVFLVRLALANAVHNACRYAQHEVRLSALPDGGAENAGVVFEVSDDGPGFPASLLQLSGLAPAAGSGHSTGLGIFLAQQIARLHGVNGRCGRVELVNRHGAVFRLLLP